MNDVRRYQLIALLAAILALTVAFVHPKPTSAPTNPRNQNTANTNVANTNAPNNTNSNKLVGVIFSTDDLPDADPAFRFALRLKTGWAAEYDAANKHIVIFDPRQTGASRDQLIISYYHGSTYAAQTGTVVPDTVEGTVLADGKNTPIRESQVQTVQAFPDWGSAAHWEYDVKASPNSDVYYRFDFAPAITKSSTSDSVLTQVLNSLTLTL